MRRPFTSVMHGGRGRDFDQRLLAGNFTPEIERVCALLQATAFGQRWLDWPGMQPTIGHANEPDPAANNKRPE